jgi:hypothetical protein
MPEADCSGCNTTFKWRKIKKTVCSKCATNSSLVECVSCKKPNRTRASRNDLINEFCAVCRKKWRAPCKDRQCTHPVVLDRSCVTCIAKLPCREFQLARSTECRDCNKRRRADNREEKLREAAKTVGNFGTQAICTECKMLYHLLSPAWVGTDDAICRGCSSDETHTCRICSEQIKLSDMSWDKKVCRPCRRAYQRPKKAASRKRHKMIPV